MSISDNLNISMTKNEKLTFAKALSETFSVQELKTMRKKALTTGMEGKVTSWSDVGLSSSISYDFNVASAVEILTVAIGIMEGTFRAKPDCIKKFVL